MSKKVRSARGEIVDFDLLRIKEEMAAAPQSLHVRKRKDFIEQRLRRKIRSIASDQEEKKEENKKKGVAAAAIDVEPNLPNTDVIEMQEVVEEKEEAPKTATKQRARKKTITSEEGENNNALEGDS